MLNSLSNGPPVTSLAKGDDIPLIALCLPSRDEVKAGFSCALSYMSFWNARNLRANVMLMEQRGAMISGQRNDMVTRGLEAGADWFMWIDTDMTFPPNGIKRLLNHHKPIVGAIYNKRVAPYSTLGHFVAEDPNRDTHDGGLIKADFMPGGFILIRAEVYRALPYPWYFETYRWAGKSPLDSFLRMIEDCSNVPPPDSVRQGLYSVKGIREWLEANEPPEFLKKDRTMSEDYNFSRKARRAGFEIFCDLDLTFEMGHIGEQVVTCERPPVGSTPDKVQQEPADAR